jgi:hypothetical protein
MNCAFSVIVWLYITSHLSFAFVQEKASKNWESICQILSCEPILKNCIQLGCLGETDCKNCVQLNSPNCVRCIDTILIEQFYSINGQSTIICDRLNSVHLTTCEFFCRLNYKTSWQCESYNNFPLCNCLWSSTTTYNPSVSTTSRPFSNLSNITFQFYLIYLILIHSTYSSNVDWSRSVDLFS